MKKNWLRVTSQDVENAILIGEILGGYREAFPFESRDEKRDEHYDLSCLENSLQVPKNHCPSCTCTSQSFGDCGHLDDIWECIGAAIEASPEAVWLWMITSNIVDDLHPHTPDRDKDRDTIEWISAMARRGHDRAELNSNLEAAALLRDGLLPPGVVVTRRKKGQRA